jgi:two-component sensor histidine kinase/streptogramin lyase
MTRIWTISQDNKDRVWFGGQSGIISYNPVTKKSRHYNLYTDSSNLTDLYTIGIIKDKNGKYWAGNWGGGLYNFDPVSGYTRAFTVIEDDSTVISEIGPLFMDSKSRLYVHGWQGGFITFNTETEKFKVFKHDATDPESVSHQNCHAFIESKTGLIWFGTQGGGINVFNPVTEKFKAFTTKDGLPHNMVLSLVEDKKGNYWAGTGTIANISCFTPPDDPFAPGCRIKFRNYDVSDGLPPNQLTKLSAYCDDDGTLYFGTLGGGMISFHPDSLKDNDFIAPVHITGFSLKNKLVTINDSNSILKSPIEYSKELLLNYRQNIISFSFSALNFIHPEKNRYAYKLENYDDDWIYTDASRRFANYTNLNPGKYIFKVKGSNNDGFWNETPTELIIIITPPFWQTAWFKVLVALGLIGLAYAFYRYRVGQIILLQRIRNKIATDLHDDIGSTLNSISVYSEVAKKDPARKDFALQMIGESSRKIIDSMSDIVWSINPENDSFDKIIFRMRSLTYNLLKVKKIDCSFKADESLNALKLPMQTRRNFYLIFKEALNNLVKYSHAARASVTLLHENRQVVLIVRDDGVGFDTSAKYNGNGLNNIRKRAGEINAVLNIESSAGEGTTVELNLKV